jgi:signal transduction histidine kinase
MSFRRRSTIRRLIPTPSASGSGSPVSPIPTIERRGQDIRAMLDQAMLGIAESLNYDQTLHNIVEAAVPLLGDWAALDIIEKPEDNACPPAIHRVAVAHRNPEMLAVGLEMTARYPERWDDASALATVVRTGQEFFLPELTDEMLVASARDATHIEFLRTLALSSVILVPLVARGRILGVLTLCMSDSKRTFDRLDLGHAQALGRKAAIVVDAARLINQAEQSRGYAVAARERVARLQSVTEALSRALTPREVAESTVSVGAEAFQATDAGVYILHAETKVLTLVACRGLDPAVIDEFRTISLTSPMPASTAARTGEVCMLSATVPSAVLSDDAATRPSRDQASRSWMALPLIANDEVLGSMFFSFPHQRAFTAEEQSFGAALARLTAQALDRSRLYELMVQARHAAETANAAKSQFLATMSHELRTPLNAFGGYLELLLMDLRGPLLPAQRTDLERMQRSHRHLLGLITDVLSFAKIDIGHSNFQMSPVTMQHALQRVQELVAPLADAKQIRCLLGPCPAAVVAMADVERVGQIILNLMGNAVKFTPAGGTVTATCESTGDNVQLHVADTGVGIPPEQFASIFEPFVQLGRTYSNPGEGVGLGLAISRDLARGMGGSLTVTSEVGRGSTFTLTLPALPPRAVSAPSPS